ncbi:MAG TPA: nuclear transport factor 2 family protein [Isosphaeraceae bacterium]|nr:nuclear transport factor 2 family protein [Isosphaeraceae bacterium]
MMVEPRWIGSRSWALVVLAGVAPACGQSNPEESIRVVRAVLDRQVVDWNSGNLDGFLGGYWNSPKVVFQSGGQRIDGWEAMRARYRRRYQAEGRAMGRLAFSALDLEPLGPEAVLARGRWRLTMPDGTTPGGLFTVIFRKLPEGWKIVHDHTSTEEVKAAEAAPVEKPRSGGTKSPGATGGPGFDTGLENGRTPLSGTVRSAH